MAEESRDRNYITFTDNSRERQIHNCSPVGLLVLTSIFLFSYNTVQDFLLREWCPTHTGIGLPISNNLIKIIFQRHAHIKTQCRYFCTEIISLVILDCVLLTIKYSNMFQDRSSLNKVHRHRTKENYKSRHFPSTLMEKPLWRIA